MKGDSVCDPVFIFGEQKKKYPLHLDIEFSYLQGPGAKSEKYDMSPAKWQLGNTPQLLLI